MSAARRKNGYTRPPTGKRCARARMENSSGRAPKTSSHAIPRSLRAVAPTRGGPVQGYSSWVRQATAQVATGISPSTGIFTLSFTNRGKRESSASGGRSALSGGQPRSHIRRRRYTKNAAGADIMPVIVAVAQIADHNARDGRMHELIVAEIDSDMGDAPMLFPAERMEKDEIAFLQLIARNM